MENFTFSPLNSSAHLKRVAKLLFRIFGTLFDLQQRTTWFPCQLALGFTHVCSVSFRPISGLKVCSHRIRCLAVRCGTARHVNTTNRQACY